MLQEQTHKYNSMEKLIVKHQNKRLTWTEMKHHVDHFATGLLKMGLKRGDRLGVWLPNTLEWVVAQWACFQTGIILVNINPAYRAHELVHSLNLVGCKALIMEPQFKSSDYIKMMNDLIPELVTMQAHQTTIHTSKLPHLKHIIQTGSSKVPGMMRFVDVYSSSIDPYYLQNLTAGLECNDPINIQFTSGTTGLPKGSTLTHKNILNNGYFCGERMKMTPNDALVVPVPLYHCFGLVLGNLAAWTHGAKIIYGSAGFDAEATLRAVYEERATAVHGVPTMFISMLSHPLMKQLDLTSLRTGIMAGSTCPIEIMKRVILEMHAKEILIGYGMTETSPLSFQTNVNDDIEKRVTTVGTVVPHVEVKIVDPKTKKTVPRNTPGELCTKGYNVMQGYWGQPDKTAEAIDKHGFMHTGDLAELDEEGYCKIVGRIKDLIIRGGENVSPREVEEFLYTHPKVKDVSVIGIPDATYGEQVCAWIIVKDKMELTADEVREYCLQIAHFKRPYKILFVDSFPMTITGKIQKYIMREKSIDMLGLQQVAQHAKQQKIIMSQ